MVACEACVRCALDSSGRCLYGGPYVYVELDADDDYYIRAEEIRAVLYW